MQETHINFLNYAPLKFELISCKFLNTIVLNNLIGAARMFS